MNDEQQTQAVNGAAAPQESGHVGPQVTWGRLVWALGACAAVIAGALALEAAL